MYATSRFMLTLAVAGTAASAMAQTTHKPAVVPPGANYPASLIPSNDGEDIIAHELATKMGLNRIDPANLRGLPSCPNPMFDLNNCHVFDPALLPTPTSNGRAGDFRTMDNFRPSTASPTRICWVGRYQNRTEPFVANESFRISIYADASGFPNLAAGPVFTREFNQQGVAGTNMLEMDCLDGESCPGTTTPAAGGWYSYSAEVAAGFPLAAQTCYWLEIVCTGSATAMPPVDTDRLWRWGASQGGTDLASLQAIDGQYTLFTRVANDRAFCVTGGLNTSLGVCSLAPQPPVCNNDPANGIAYEVAQFLWRGSLFGSNPMGNTWVPAEYAENFKFSSPQSVSSFCFTGYWGNTPPTGGVPTVPVPSGALGMRLTYYSNQGTNGVPGDPVPMATFAEGAPGVTFLHNGVSFPWQASMTHPPVNFEADECYWASVARVNVQGQEFFWLSTTSTAVSADNRFAGRTTATAVPGAWGPIGPNASYNLPFLLNAGSLTASNGCLEAIACEVTIPPGSVAENEADCSSVNSGCDGSQTFSQIQCDQTIVGTVSYNGATRDSDWYQLTLTEPKIVTLTVSAEFFGTAAFIGANDTPMVDFNCAFPVTFSPLLTIGQCAPASRTVSLGVGTYTLVVQPNLGDLVSCAGTSGNQYTITMSCQDAVPPANDLCENAITLDTPCAGQDVTAEGFTFLATNDNMPACGPATIQTAPGVWYKVVGNGSPITVSACSNPSSFDGQMGVFTGSCGAMTCLAGDDDGCGVGGGMSTVTFNSTAGTTYYILVHAWGNAWYSQGLYSIVLSSAGTCEGGGCPVDWNDDGQVNSGDISSFLTAWIASVQAPNLVADFNNDGVTNSGDISAFLSAWITAVQTGNC